MRLQQQQRPRGRQTPGQRRTTRRRHCDAEQDAPLCEDLDWVPKCPSGCRLQGLLSRAEGRAESRLRALCEAAALQQDAAERSMSSMARVYRQHRRLLVGRHVSGLRLADQAAGLAGNLTSLRGKSSRLGLRLRELQRHVQEQLEELHRAEVDVDLRLRSCSGSCRRSLPLAVDHGGYEALQADLQLLRRSTKAAPPPQHVPRLQLQPVEVGPAPPAGYRAIPAVRTQLLTQFEDIEQNRLVLEQLEAPAGGAEEL